MAEQHFLQANLDQAAVNLLLFAVNFTLEKWPGGDPAQQEGLMLMRSNLFRMNLEFQMKSDE